MRLRSVAFIGFGTLLGLMGSHAYGAGYDLMRFSGTSGIRFANDVVGVGGKTLELHRVCDEQYGILLYIDQRANPVAAIAHPAFTRK